MTIAKRMAAVVLAGSALAAAPSRVGGDAGAGDRGARRGDAAARSRRTEVGSQWTDRARDYLQESGEYFFGTRGNSFADLERLRRAETRLQAAVPPAEELYGALVGGDHRMASAAIAALAVSDRPEPRLVELVLERYPREPDPAIRRLVLNALSRAGRDWVRSHGDAVVTALAPERHPSLLTVAALDVIALLDRRDLLRVTTAVLQNAEPPTRAVLYGGVHLREGRTGLRDLSEQLRHVGREDLATEAENAAHERSTGE